MINKWIMKETNLMKRSLEKWGRAPIILGGVSTHLFGGSSTHYFKRAGAPVIQEGTSTHYSKTTKQRTNEQMQNEHERIKFMKCSLEKWGRAPIIFEGSSTHYFGGSSTHYLRGHEHSLFKEQSNRERVDNCKMNMKELSSWNALSKKWGRAPIIFEGSSTHYLRGHEHSPFEEHSIREQMNEHTWI
jgi:hypothetical protein